VALIVAVVLGAPMLLQRGSEAKRPFDESPERRLAKERPAIVLLGDSMLETRIEPRRLNELAHQRCSVLSQSGSSSAMWFLMLKNILGELKPPPRWAVIFFRDRQLTVPAYRTEGGYRPTMESYMRDSEPVADALLPLFRKGPERWLDRASLAIWPAQHRRDVWGDKVKNWALDAVASSREYQGIRDATHTIFELKKLRADTGYNESAGAGGRQKLDDDDHDFPTAVGRSFLPPMLAVARAHGIRLLFSPPTSASCAPTWKMPARSSSMKAATPRSRPISSALTITSPTRCGGPTPSISGR